MKVHITGPFAGGLRGSKLPHMHLEVEMETLPRPGETIILNDGNCYTVEYTTWWIDTMGKASEAYERHIGQSDEDVDGEGHVKHISVVVEPSHGGYMTSHRMVDALRAFADVLTEASGTEEERKARYDKMIKDVTGRS